MYSRLAKSQGLGAKPANGISMQWMWCKEAIDRYEKGVQFGML